jgi:MoaA/NifB/PqqE/SkfB family radical SAM enzyme
MKSLDILRYLRSNNSNVLIIISTNGGARDKSFWQALAQTDINAKIEFCLDGLEDTHHLYRQDTTFSKVLENACNFISSGGKAIWKMVKFDHNLHQIDACEKLSKELGFHQFNLIDHGRNHGVALNRDGTRSHVLGLDKWPLSISAQDLILQEQNDTMKAILTKKEYDTNSKLTCFSRSSKSIYISAEGKVYPCCWLGFSPDTYNQGGTGLYNNQIAPLISKNDLNEYDLETCMQWFIEIEKSWSKNSYEDGRLMRCDASCGTCTNK